MDQPSGLLDFEDLDAARGPSGKSLRVAMYDAWDGNDGHSISGANRYRIAALGPQVRKLAAAAGIEPEEFFRSAIARFRAENATRTKKMGLPIFVDDFAQWATAAPAQAKPTGPRELPPPPREYLERYGKAPE